MLQKKKKKTKQTNTWMDLKGGKIYPQRDKDLWQNVKPYANTSY